MKKNQYTRGDKIMICIYQLGEGKKKKIAYEDIVVGLFKKQPDDFHLKGYPEYPDSSDSTQRLLYEYKKKGHILVQNKVFSLTDSGVELAENLLGYITKIKNTQTGHRISRSMSSEIERIKSLEGYHLFQSEKTDRLTEDDYYRLFSVTVKTNKSSFYGRYQNIKKIMDEITSKYENDTTLRQIKNYYDFLLRKYKNITDFFLNKSDYVN